MLSLQSRRFSNPEVRREFEDAIGRVSTLAHVHDRMQRHTLGGSDAASYFADLCVMLRSLVPKSAFLICEGRGRLPDDHVESLTLLVNELVTNASKYAFVGEQTGEIRVSFDGSGAGWKLTVCDNGAGLPAGFDLQHATTFGATLIRTLAGQLNASVAYTSNAGTSVEVTSAFHTREPLGS
jgi:two-component sensor histidine kinase